MTRASLLGMQVRMQIALLLETSMCQNMVEVVQEKGPNTAKGGETCPRDT